VIEPRDAVTVIEPRSGWQFIDFRELREYRDLFYFLVWRDIKVLYAQTILGFSWAILLPLTQILIFTVVFGKVAKVSTEGIPYFLFSSVAIIPWTYMSQATTQSSQSLVQEQGMLGKIYFPRLIFPLTPVLAKLVDFGISMVIILAVILYYRVLPTWNLLLFPVLVVMMMGIAGGSGMWLSSLNPIVGVIEGYRACLLGTPIPWSYVWPGMISTVLLLASGVLYFKRMERVFVDVI
jgi:lipopolysaccharide transport system permease protein